MATTEVYNRVQHLISGPKGVKVTLLCLFLASLFMLSGRFLITKSVMGGDAVIYYINIKSILYDGDLDLRNDYEHFDKLTSPYTGNRKIDRIPKINPDTGMLPILYPIGNVILLAPFFFIGHLSALMLQSLGFAVIADGFSDIYQISVALGSLIYAFLGLVVIYRIGIRFFDSQTALFGTLLIWAGTPLIYYMTMESLMSHALSMFIISVFMYCWLLAREHKLWYLWLALGVSGGLITIIRYQDGLFLIIPALGLAMDWIKGVSKTDKLNDLIRFFVFALGILVIASFQFYVNYVLNGSILSTGYTVEGYHPQNLFKYWSSPKFFSMLFSPESGLLLWAPIVSFSLFGLYKLYKDDRGLSIPFLFPILLQFYIVASWHDPLCANISETLYPS